MALGRLLGEIEDGQHAVRAGTAGELCERWYSQPRPTSRRPSPPSSAGSSTAASFPADLDQ